MPPQSKITDAVRFRSVSLGLERRLFFLGGIVGQNYKARLLSAFLCKRLWFYRLSKYPFNDFARLCLYFGRPGVSLGGFGGNDEWER
jgi:hypothetical protein